MKQVISKHNKQILSVSKPAPNAKDNCNCRLKTECPLNGECQQSCLVYKATVTTPSEVKEYIGCTESSFKIRFANHKQSFKHEKHSKATTLSSYIWKLKNSHTKYDISWEILSKAAPYSCGSRRCDLCLTEKMLIATADPGQLLNSRAELISKCRHRNKYLLMNLKT